MRREGSKLSQKQKGVRDKMKMMHNEDPEIEEKAKNVTVFDQGPVSTYKEATEVDSKISQVICIYVVLQIGASLSGKNPDASRNRVWLPHLILWTTRLRRWAVKH